MSLEETREIDLQENIRGEKKQIYLATLEIIKKDSNNVFC